MVIQQPVRSMELRHLSRLTDDRGILEHAKGTQPRFEHGYCTDDNARLLVVAVRQHDQPQASWILARVAARFLLDAQASDGRMRNRMSFERMWMDEPSTDDCWGRALWGFGAAVARSSDTELRNRCYEAFTISQDVRSPYLRTMCFSVLGAAEILEVEPAHKGALRIMRDAYLQFISLGSGDSGWLWPEERLQYANAVIPEAMIAVGVAMSDESMLQRGLMLLEWLVEHESRDGRLSVTPVGGRTMNDMGPMFDQQPIEVAAIADAAHRAHAATGHAKWLETLDLSAAWFMGNNDAGESMIDLESGGGYDGLHADGVNLNQGAESTLAMISTMQHCSSSWLI